MAETFILLQSNRAMMAEIHLLLQREVGSVGFHSLCEKLRADVWIVINLLSKSITWSL